MLKWPKTPKSKLRISAGTFLNNLPKLSFLAFQEKHLKKRWYCKWIQYNLFLYWHTFCFGQINNLQLFCLVQTQYKTKNKTTQSHAKPNRVVYWIQSDPLNENRITRNFPSMGPFHGKFVPLWHLFILRLFAAPTLISCPVNAACHQPLRRTGRAKKAGDVC